MQGFPALTNILKRLHHFFFFFGPGWLNATQIPFSKPSNGWICSPAFHKHFLDDDNVLETLITHLSLVRF